MNPSRIFIERPVATSLLMVAIMLVGMIAYRFLPLSALPEVDYPTIRVLTSTRGAGPEVMTRRSPDARTSARVRQCRGQPDDVMTSGPAPG